MGVQNEGEGPVSKEEVVIVKGGVARACRGGCVGGIFPVYLQADVGSVIRKKVISSHQLSLFGRDLCRGREG